jgi:hypothetical protein
MQIEGLTVSVVAARVADLLPETDIQGRFRVVMEGAQRFPLVAAAAMLDPVMSEHTIEACGLLDRSEVDAKSYRPPPSFRFRNFRNDWGQTHCNHCVWE